MMSRRAWSLGLVAIVAALLPPVGAGCSDDRRVVKGDGPKQRLKGVEEAELKALRKGRRR